MDYWQSLAAFLDARLDEDEAAARAATGRQPYDEWDAVGAGGGDDIARSHWSVVKIAIMYATPAAKDLAEHIARHDPARVLRDVKASRAVVRRCAARVNEMDAHPNGLVSARALLARQTLLDLAAAHRGHPGYRREWAL